MKYYTFKLNEESKELCTIITPFGKHKYKHLPLGHKCVLDFPQQIMEGVLEGLDHIEVNLDNISIFDTT